MGAKKIMIFGSMPCKDWGFLSIYHSWPDIVIAADGGVSCALSAGFVPSIYVGDNDSGGHALPEMECVVLPTEKDWTDLQVAYDKAVSLEAQEIIVTSCTGGRLDHHMAAFQLLERASRHGIHCMILDSCNAVEFLTPGRYSIKQESFHYFSLIPVDAVLEQVYIRNAKYVLHGMSVFRGDSLTVSNEWIDTPAEVSFTEGCCYLIRSRDP